MHELPELRRRSLLVSQPRQVMLDQRMIHFDKPGHVSSADIRRLLVRFFGDFLLRVPITPGPLVKAEIHAGQFGECIEHGLILDVTDLHFGAFALFHHRAAGGKGCCRGVGAAAGIEQPRMRRSQRVDQRRNGRLVLQTGQRCGGAIHSDVFVVFQRRDEGVRHVRRLRVHDLADAVVKNLFVGIAESPIDENSDRIDAFHAGQNLGIQLLDAATRSRAKYSPSGRTAAGSLISVSDLYASRDFSGSSNSRRNFFRRNSQSVSA